ncbi:MAG TPA: hypothetical protein ENJ46_02905, partial [Hellea balneolensis]|nr:hypothetical protein [Hellea balneolensis]
MTIFASHMTSGTGGGDVYGRNIALSQLYRFIESAIVFLLLFQFSTALVALLTTDPNDLESQSLLARSLWYPGYVLVLLLMVRYLPAMIRIAVLNPILIVCVLWCGVSYIWSIEPQVTLRRSIALLMTTSFGLFLAMRYDWNQLVQRFALLFLVTALISLFLGLFIPQLGQMQEIHQGAWRGAWLEKNSFGTNMAK